MSLVVLGIVTGVNEQNNNVNSVRVDDWTVKRTIIASNVNSVYVDDWTVKRTIIASNVNSVYVDDWTAERAGSLLER